MQDVKLKNLNSHLKLFNNKKNKKLEKNKINE